MSVWKLIIVAVALMPISAYTAPTFIAKPAKLPLTESNSPDVNVSGSVIVGVLTNEASSGAAIQRLQLTNVPAPKEASDSVCLTVQSRDGAYYSQNTFNLPAGSSGSMVRIPYDKSAYLDQLKQYGRDELSLRATPGECGKKAPGYYVVDATTTLTKPPESIHVLVNSFGATDVFCRIGINEPISCKPIREGRRTSFDYRCEVQWPHGEIKGPFTVTIERERFGREMPAVSLPLYLKPRNEKGS